MMVMTNNCTFAMDRQNLRILQASALFSLIKISAKALPLYLKPQQLLALPNVPNKFHSKIFFLTLTLNLPPASSSNTQHGLCPYCNRHFKQIKIHIQTVHFKLKPYKCQFCSQGFGRSGNRLMHMRNMHAEVYDQRSAEIFFMLEKRRRAKNSNLPDL